MRSLATALAIVATAAGAAPVGAAAESSDPGGLWSRFPLGTPPTTQPAAPPSTSAPAAARSTPAPARPGRSAAVVRATVPTVSARAPSGLPGTGTWITLLGVLAVAALVFLLAVADRSPPAGGGDASTARFRRGRHGRR